MITVCFFSGDITRSGGTERVSTMIANALAVQMKYRILFLSLTEQKNSLFFPLNNGIEHYALGKKWISPGPGYLKIVPKLRRFLKDQQVDVIIDIDIVLDILSLLAVRGSLRTRVISWEHFGFQYENSILYRRIIRNYSVKRTDYIVTLTKHDEENYQHYLKRQERIKGIYNPMERISYEGENEREKWIITAGNLIHIKGIDYLARIAPEILKKHKDWKWIVLGDGELRGMLEEVQVREGLKEQLILPGIVKNIAEYMQKAQIFVLMSRSEGLPMVLLEAKAGRLPSISFNIPGPSEIIQDKVNGFLVTPFDWKEMAGKIGQLIEDEPLRKAFRENTVYGMEKFQMESILLQWNEVIDQVMEEESLQPRRIKGKKNEHQQKKITQEWNIPCVIPR